MEDARLAVLARLFDYAGLFPPASLSLRAAAAEYAAARGGAVEWMLGRFVCPASMLGELEPLTGGERWPVSALADSADAFSQIEPYCDGDGTLRVEQIETRIDPMRSPAEIAYDLATMPHSSARVFVEIPAGDEELILRIADTPGVSAKIRCGGAIVPTAGEIAATIRLCESSIVALKATAGLHHPVSTADAHGFLNLCAAALLVRRGGVEPEVIRAAVAERDPSAFVLTRDRFAWKNESFDGRECAEMRDLFVGIGSCSFSEPVADLQGMGVLPL